MSIIKNFTIIFFLTLFFLNNLFAEDIKEVAKHKDWQTYVIIDENGKICFAQSKPVLQAPKNNIREARLFITFRPSEKISDEISELKSENLKMKSENVALKSRITDLELLNSEKCLIIVGCKIQTKFKT